MGYQYLVEGRYANVTKCNLDLNLRTHSLTLKDNNTTFNCIKISNSLLYTYWY